MCFFTDTIESATLYIKTHVYKYSLKCSIGPQIIFFVNFLFNLLSQHYVFNGNATLASGDSL